MDKTKYCMNIINALALPVVILLITLIGGSSGAGLLPETIRNLMIPSDHLYLQVFCVFVIGLVCLSSIRWTFQLLAFIGFGWLSSLVLPSFSTVEVANTFCFSISAFYGIALFICCKQTLTLRFFPTVKLPAPLLILLFFAVDVILNYTLLNRGDSAATTWMPNTVALATGFVGSLVAWGLVKLLVSLGLPADLIVCRTCAAPVKPAPKKPSERKAAAPARPKKRPAPAPVHSISGTPSDETGKLLSQSDLRQIKTKKSRKSQSAPAQPAPAQPAPQKPAEPQTSSDSDPGDWLKKHLDNLD